ncbi:MAG: hypothetical protein WD733_23320 [Bryobacterales bacterium]
MIEMIPTRNTSIKKPAGFRPRAARQTGRTPLEQDRWASLARAVLLQAIDDAAHGARVEFEDLRPWAVVARLPSFYVRRAIQRANEAAPLTAA